MRYDPRAPFERRYVRDGQPLDPDMEATIRKGVLALCNALGYDMNTVEFAVRDGIPYAIDFMNPAPDSDAFSVGEDNFRWVVDTVAKFLVDRVRDPRPVELTGDWPSRAPAPRALR